jgi:RNA polymerase sigma-70 factor (ECF subfamily)
MPSEGFGPWHVPSHGAMTGDSICLLARTTQRTMTTESRTPKNTSDPTGSRRTVATCEARPGFDEGDVAMTKYAAGEDHAFQAVYDAVAPRLYAFLRRQVHDDHRGSDLLQETFLRIHRARGTFLAGGAVMPWAFAIARRLVIDQLRRDRRAPPVADDSGLLERAVDADAKGPNPQCLAGELTARLARELGRLPELQRTAFALLKQDGLTLAETAQVLGTSVMAVKQRAHRAYLALRAALSDHPEYLAEVRS